MRIPHTVKGTFYLRMQGGSQMDIESGRIERLMSKEIAYGQKIDTIFIKMGAKAMPHRMTV